MAGWAALVAAVCLVAGAEPAEPSLYTELHATAPAAGSSTALPDLTKLAQAAVPAVVGVVTTQAPPPALPQDESLRELFDRLHDGPRKGIGSGFIIHRDGWILTNAHVVEGSDRIEIDLGGGAPRLPARIVGADAESDVALLKVNAGRPLPVVPLGDSDRITIAEWVLVIGSPFGLDHSVTKGIVSHTGRSDISPVGRPGSYDFIQTDAAINPGNSGGPLLNLRGEVVGIATAVNATGQGIGFAIPINMAKEILGQLRANGRVVRSWLGIAVRERAGPLASSPSAAAMGTGSAQGSAGAPVPGVVVTEVATGGPAEAAGMRVGDVITAFQGHAIQSPARLRWYVSTAGVGREVEVRVRRGDEPERAVRVSLGEVPAREQARAQARAALGE